MGGGGGTTFFLIKGKRHGRKALFSSLLMCMCDDEMLRDVSATKQKA